MASIQVQNLSFTYDGSYDTIFDQVSFVLDTDWKLGFVGRNGRGKTTFLKLLLGEHEYRGAIRHSAIMRYFPYEVADASLPARQVIEGICPAAEPWQIDCECNQLEIEPEALERPFQTLSNGEQTKIQLAALFLGDEGFLLIDEPTNHLDMQARGILGEYLNTKKGFILVSHDRALLDACTDHTLSINRANIELINGSFSVWQENKERRDAFELAENEKLSRDIQRLQAAAAQSRDWADKVEATKIGHRDPKQKSWQNRDYVGEQSRRMQQRRKNLERRQQTAIAEKSKLLHNIERADALRLRPLGHYADRLVSLSGVGLSYGEKTVLEDFSLMLLRGERVALCGKNGCGKSSVLRLVLEELLPGGGEVQRASGLKISYVAQDASGLSGSLMDYARSYRVDETLFLTILRKLDFERVQFEKDMRSYSEGQKKKVLLARSLSESAHLYIWDEPLNFIDLLSRMQIEALIQRCEPTMLFVEHDRAFCESVSTRMIQL